MASSDGFFEARNAQAVFKHGLLTRYAYYFAGRAGHATDGRVAFIDGYAGEGRYAADRDAVGAAHEQRLKLLSTCRVPRSERAPNLEAGWQATSEISQSAKIRAVEAVQVVKRDLNASTLRKLYDLACERHDLIDHIAVTRRGDTRRERLLGGNRKRRPEIFEKSCHLVADPRSHEAQELPAHSCPKVFETHISHSTGRIDDESSNSLRGAHVLDHQSDGGGQTIEQPDLQAPGRVRHLNRPRSYRRPLRLQPLKNGCLSGPRVTHQHSYRRARYLKAMQQLPTAKEFHTVHCRRSPRSWRDKGDSPAGLCPRRGM